jgi:hypothetical protein
MKHIRQHVAVVKTTVTSLIHAGCLQYFSILGIKTLRTQFTSSSILSIAIDIILLYLDNLPPFWLIDYLLFYVPPKNISLIWRRHHYRWRAAEFRPMLGAQSLWAGRDLYRAAPAVTRSLGFSGLIRRTAPFSRLLRHTRGCGGSILPRILTGLLHFETTPEIDQSFNICSFSCMVWSW